MLEEAGVRKDRGHYSVSLRKRVVDMGTGLNSK